MLLRDRLLLRTKEVVGDLVSILTSDSMRLQKRRVLSTYLRLTAMRYLWGRGERRSSVVGFSVSAFSPRTLHTLFTEIFVKAEYFFRTDNPRPLIIDCGSNIGMSILFFSALYPDAEIIGFEPGEQAFRQLQNNIRANRLGEHVVVHNMAVGGADGPIEFYYDPDDPGSLLMSTVRQRMPKEARQVMCARLSTVVDREVDFLKLDVEGAENAVLNDLYETGKLALVKQMVIEYHHHINQDNDSLSRILRLLEEYQFGYQIRADCEPTADRGVFQDIVLYAYRKGPAIAPAHLGAPP